MPLGAGVVKPGDQGIPIGLRGVGQPAATDRHSQQPQVGAIVAWIGEEGEKLRGWRGVQGFGVIAGAGIIG